MCGRQGVSRGVSLTWALRPEAARNALHYHADRVVRMQALDVHRLHSPVAQAAITVEGGLELAPGIFTEHQVLTVEAGELLLVFTFDCGLDLCT